jgi:hypothetical protein
VRFLVQRGADRAVRDDRGMTAADIAGEQHFTALAQLLTP